MFYIYINLFLENSCSGILIVESCGLGELLRASFASIISYGHRLDVMHSFHLVVEYIRSVKLDSLIICSTKPLVKCAFTPANVIFLPLICACLLPVMCFKYAIFGVIIFYDDTSNQTVLLKIVFLGFLLYYFLFRIDIA